MMCESKFWDEISFLTLTYRDEALTYGKNAATLVPRDLQLFIKRLRKYLGIRVSFYGCGEYGDKTSRPHYHIILFGHAFLSDRVPTRKTKSGYAMFRSPSLDKLWPHGDAFVCDATHETMQYTAGYVLKKLTGKMSSYYEEQGIHPEFSRASRNPAIGKKFYDKYHDEIFNHHDFIRVSDFKTSIPQYFNRLFKRDHYYNYERVKALRQIKSNETDFNDPHRSRSRGIIKSIEHFNRYMREFE